MVGPGRCQAAPTGPSRSPPALQVPGATSRPLRAPHDRPGGHMRPDSAAMGANRLAAASLPCPHIGAICPTHVPPRPWGAPGSPLGVISGGAGRSGRLGGALAVLRSLCPSGLQDLVLIYIWHVDRPENRFGCWHQSGMYRTAGWAPPTHLEARGDHDATTPRSYVGAHPNGPDCGTCCGSWKY